ncbi:MobF family relaxase [Sphingomonas solaris]|uniref:Conjugative relaxase n=1 Tax=Alterirhizorhabdus solaris TaxID=2529389 RepID=A0A558R014_9SPHN|nr:MobF family relaxase [Sphingomonas solaris]TVV72753.1 conjugative relaxase [Sphingomonas solaris]
MLSVSSVRSAKGAAGYFAADNYYTAGEAETSGEWFGKGAAALGLEGKVYQDRFEALLGGRLPDGTQVGTPDRHRAGVDLTFSLPKSWSLLALVGGDRRILDAYKEAVKDTLRWAESRAAETRMEVKGKERVVATGNLVAALFEHDTSRAQDPQAHLHAVIANVTQGPDGKWRALHNEKLWSLNTLLNSIAMTGFRERVEALGYEIGDRTQHGNFEAAGIGRNLVMAFSTRRQQILDKVAEMGSRTPETFAAATLMTRPSKAPAVDRTALYEAWRESAKDAGLDLAPMIAAADARRQAVPTGWTKLAHAIGSVAERASTVIDALRERLGLAPADPYLPRASGRMGPAQVAAAHAVASALRHLEQREAAFLKTDIYKAALDTGLPVRIEAVERRVDTLTRAGQLIEGRRTEMITTAQALETERRMLGEVDAGRGKGAAYAPVNTAVDRLTETAKARSGIILNTGQSAAGAMILASPDRIVAIQGVAGAGKSSVLAPAAEIVSASGHEVLGLAVQNTLVQMLQRETGITSMTVARFLKSHDKLLGTAPDPGALAEARRTLGGAAILVDEASMLSNPEQLKLVRLANLIGVGRMAFVGDARQLGAVDAGKPFSVMQQAGAPTAQMSQNLRARGDAIKVSAAAAQIGAVDRAMEALAPFTIEAPGRGSAEAADRWLALAPDERSRTAIYASGRRLRGEVNKAVQAGLIARGEIGPGSIELTVLERVSLTDEELRRSQSYEVGMIVEISRPQVSQRLPRARATVEKADHRTGTVTLRLSGGRERILRPEKLRIRDGESPLQLYDPKTLTLHEKDRIRWTANDHQRGLFNADQATVVAIDARRVEVRTSQGQTVSLPRGDPMLQRLDLAYALNAHMAQGLTSDRGIAVMETRDTRLVNQQTFLVTVTRLRDALTLVVDRAGQLERQLLRNPGGKTSALETSGELRGVRNSTATKTSGPTPPEKMLDPDQGRSKPFELGI